MRISPPLPVPFLTLAILFGQGRLSAETYHNWCPLHFDAAQTAAGLASPLRDVDGDGCENVIEYLANTDPWDPGSRLEMEPGTDPETTVFAMATDRIDVEYEFVVSHDLLSWVQEATHLGAGASPTWHRNGFAFMKVGVKRRIGFTIDSDQDGLDDYFEEVLAASDPGDSITHIGEVHPADDFDHDGTDNLDEEDNTPEPVPGGSFASPGVISATALNGVLASTPTPEPATLVVHTPLR